MRRCHLHIPHPFQFLVGEFQTGIHIFNIRSEIDAEGTGIRIRSQIGFYIVDQSATFAKRHVQLTVHARTAKNVIQEIKGRTLVVIRIISTAADHHMCLMSIFRHYQTFGHIQRRRHTLIIYRYCRNIGKMLLRQTDNLLEIILPLNKEYHIPRLIESPGKRKDIFCAETPQQIRFTENIPSQRMIAEDHIFEIIENQFRRIVLV